MRRTLVGVGLLVVTSIAPAQPYTANRIVQVGQFGLAGINGRFDLAPAVNSAGQVAFTGRTATAVGVYRSDGLSATTIESTADAGRTYHGPAINPAGQVAFAQTYGTVSYSARVGVGSGGPVGIVGETGSNNPAPLVGPAINASGVVAFYGTLSDQWTGAVYVGTPGAVTAVATDGVGPFASVGPFNNLGWGSGPAVNAAGAVAFAATVGGQYTPAVYVAANGTFTQRAVAGGDLAKFGAVQLNDLGTVAFAATRTGGGAGLYTVDAAGNRVTVAETGPVFSYFDDPGFGPAGPALNNTNRVAFLAGLAGGGKGIFTGPDPVADKVVVVGDSLDGSTVADLGFGRFGLNDAGTVVAYVSLADGRSGIYTFAPVPEPAAVGLTAVAGLMGLRRAARKRSAGR